MADLSLNPDMNITVTARFISKGTETALTGSDYEFRLFEKDFMEDDYLGKSPLDENGTAKVSFRQSAFKDFLNPESVPDLYFALYNGEALIFQSKVINDVDVKGMEIFKMGEGEVVDLGDYIV
ncbi:MAG TPA: hypothetical protein VK489_05590 [Ferruginibacter sp.]|nr:hypothetical protein [Ferruginibacter sp.]